MGTAMTIPPMPTFWPATDGLLYIGPMEAPEMASDNFDEVMEHIFRSEGGWSDHADDPGGATNLGITIGTLSDYRGRKVTKDEVRALTRAEAMEIYRKNYWLPSSCDHLPAGVDFCVMDAAVNSGPGRAAKWLQRAVGAKADGKIGAKTLAAVETVPSATTIERMCDDRLAFLKGLAHWRSFGRGWSNRVSSVRAAALAMARDPVDAVAPPAAPMPPPKPPSKPLDIGRYSKMVGSLIGAVLAWAVTQNFVPEGLISAEQIDTLAVIVGGVIGTFLAPKNAEA